MSRDLEDYFVGGFAVSGEGTSSPIIYVGTGAGAYRSNDLGDSWVLMTDGLAAVEYDATISEHVFSGLQHPVRTVAVDPVNPNRIYSGVGLGNLVAPKGFVSEYKLYRMDSPMRAGARWNGLLDIDSLPGARGATVYSIEIPDVECDSTGCPSIYVGTDKGVFFSSDRGRTFFSLGRPRVMFTRDAGGTWQECTATSCPRRFVGEVCSDDKGTCLPLSLNSGETLPNVRRISAIESGSGFSLYANVFDTGHMDGACSGYVSDPERAYSVGGLFRSDDGGRTWARADLGSSSQLPRTLRCDGAESLAFSHSTNLLMDYVIEESDPSHIIVLMEGAKPGYFERIGGEWRNLMPGNYSSWGISSVCGSDNACLEGGQPGGLWNESVPEVAGGFDRGKFDSGDSLYLALNRVGLRMSPSDGGTRFDFENLSQDWMPTDSEEGEWAGTGLDDTCMYGGVVQTRSGMVAATADSGVLRSEDHGRTWAFPPDRSNWGLTSGSNGMAIVTDSLTGHVFVSVVENDWSVGSVLATSDSGATWSVIGGHCPAESEAALPCASSNNLEPAVLVKSLAVDLSSDLTDLGSGVGRRILAGTASHGLWTYAPSESVSGWSQVSGEGCPSEIARVPHVFTDSALPDYAFAAVQGLSSSGAYNSAGNSTKDSAGNLAYETEEGIYSIRLSDLTCTRLWRSAPTEVPVYYPSQVTLSQDTDGAFFLLASGVWGGWPVVHRSPLDVSNPSTATQWKMVMDFYYATDEAGNRVSRNNPLVAPASDRWWDEYLPSHPSYTEHFKLATFPDLDFSVLVRSPSNPSLLIAAMQGDKTSDRATPKYLYISRDSGQTFEIQESLVGAIPTARLSAIQFTEGGDTGFLSLGCSAIQAVLTATLFR